VEAMRANAWTMRDAVKRLGITCLDPRNALLDRPDPQPSLSSPFASHRTILQFSAPFSDIE